MRPSILITGFGPFPGVEENITGQLAADVAQRASETIPNVTLKAATLSTAWAAAPEQLDALLAETLPNIILHFGVARDADHLRLESCARNTCRNAEDACGLQPLSAFIDTAGPERLTVTIPIEHICRRLNAQGFTASLSDDAGGYLCNAVLYKSLQAAADSARATRVGFIHVPVRFTEPGFTREIAIRAGVEIIAACLNDLDR